MRTRRFARRARMLVPAALDIVVILYVVMLEVMHRKHYGHYFSYGAHIDQLNEDFNIGIPGQRKLYWARLFNFGVLPMKVTACDYITDALQPGTELPYAIQRYDPLTKTWQTVLDFEKEYFCTPAPTSTIKDDIVSRWIWPGTGINVMEGEATGARDHFQKGDLARFVVFTNIRKGNQWESAIFSEPFEIQDQVIREEGDSFRVKH